jgi:hypothetical protein
LIIKELIKNYNYICKTNIINKNKTMGLLIFIGVLLTILNIATTKELTNILKDSRLDNTFFYRLCLIPPIGIITYCLSVIVITITVLIITIIDIWYK